MKWSIPTREEYYTLKLGLHERNATRNITFHKSGRVEARGQLITDQWVGIIIINLSQTLMIKDIPEKTVSTADNNEHYNTYKTFNMLHCASVDTGPTIVINW